MNKIGHIRITQKLPIYNLQQYTFWLLLGSILPDIMLHTYLTGHIYKKSFGQISKMMQRLEKYGKPGRISSLQLGFILHYIEDYFTYPHNEVFQGSMHKHCKYEMELTEYLQNQYKELNDTEPDGNRQVMSAEMLVDYIQKQHQQYCQENQGFENDRKYILRVAGTVALSFSLRFTEVLQKRYKDMVVTVV